MAPSKREEAVFNKEGRGKDNGKIPKVPLKRVPLRVPHFDVDFSARRYKFDVKAISNSKADD